jgi:hypothetical protein
MILKKVLCFQILIIIALNLKAQYNPFFHTYSAAGDVAVASIDLVSDSGYILNASDGGTNGGDFLVIKVDINGNEQWRYHNNKFDGLDSSNNLFVLKSTLDHGFIGGGIIDRDQSTGNFKDALVVKLDSNGNLEWEKLFDYSYYDEVNSIAINEDTTYLIAIRTYGKNVIVKINNSGDTLWTSSVPNPIISNFTSIDEILQVDSAFYFLAQVDSLTPTFNIVGFNTLIKTDTLGSLIWQKNYRDTASVYGNRYYRFSDDSTFLINCVMASSSLYYMQQNRIDLQGNWLSSVYPPFGGKFETDSTSYYPVSGSVNADSVYLRKGNFITGNYRNIHGFLCLDCLYSDFLLDKQEDFLISGVQDFLGRRGIVLKGIDTLISVGDDVLPNNGESVRVFPNPTSEWIHFQMNKINNYNIQLFNALGDVVSEYSNLYLPSFSIKINSLPMGFYYYNINNGRQKIFAGKIIIN